MKKIIFILVMVLSIGVVLAQTEIPIVTSPEEAQEKFNGQAGFIFFEGATFIPIFYFHENLLQEIGCENFAPALYKGPNAPKLKKSGKYYYFVDINTRIVKASEKDVVTLKGNAYLGIKANGYPAWLAYELESQELYPQGNLFYLRDPQAGGIDLALKITGYKKLE